MKRTRPKKGPKSVVKKKLETKISETQKFSTLESYAKASKDAAEYAHKIYNEWFENLEDRNSYVQYPLNVDIICAFLKDMREEWGFALSTVEHIFSKALRRYELIHFGRDT